MAKRLKGGADLVVGEGDRWHAGEACILDEIGVLEVPVATLWP